MYIFSSKAYWARSLPILFDPPSSARPPSWASHSPSPHLGLSGLVEVYPTTVLREIQLWYLTCHDPSLWHVLYVLCLGSHGYVFRVTPHRAPKQACHVNLWHALGSSPSYHILTWDSSKVICVSLLQNLANLKVCQFCLTRPPSWTSHFLSTIIKYKYHIQSKLY